MQPCGMFESEGPGEEMAAMAGRPANSDDLAQFVAALAAYSGRGAVSATLSMQEGMPWAILARADGSTVRAELATLDEQPLTASELEARARLAMPDTPIASMGLIRAPDAYYYGHKRDVALPVFRVIYDDEEDRRLYLDPRTGELAGFVDSATRNYRWWFNGLHRVDFVDALRQRPLWDMVTVPLMLGVSLLCAIGLCLGVRRLWRMRR